MSTCPRCRRSYSDDVRFCAVDGTLLVAATVTDPHLGKTLMGQFHLVALAGRGAMGTVYRAEQRNMDRTVAVKILRRDLLKDELAVKRFLREARAAARLSHPHIVTVHVIGETDDRVPFIAMEFVDGETLADLCDREPVIDSLRALKIARQIASALAEAHQHGIVHRDLKPENILLAAKRQHPEFVKVLDFGIAKLLRDEAGDGSQITRDGTIFGTPHYISPEQASGQEVDARADLYSLGVILYRMTTGQLPFEGTSSMQVLLSHVRDTPRPPREIRPDLPMQIESLILTAMEKDRAHRFQDSESFVAAIDTISAELASDGQVPAESAAARTLLGLSLPKHEGSAPLEIAPTPTPRPQRADERSTVRLDIQSKPSAKRASKSSSRSRSGSGDRELVSTGRIVLPATAGAAIADDPSRTKMGEMGLESWAADGERVASEPVFDDVTDAGARSRYWVIAMMGAAVLIGGVGGVLYALRESPRAGVAANVPHVEGHPVDAGASGGAPLYEQQIASMADITLRLGFGAPPGSGARTLMRIHLSDGKGPISGARIVAAWRGVTGSSEEAAVHADVDGYSAEVVLGAPGRQRINVVAHLPDQRRFGAHFDISVIAQPAAAPPKSAAATASTDASPIASAPLAPAPALAPPVAAAAPRPIPHKSPSHEVSTSTRAAARRAEAADDPDDSLLPVTVLHAKPTTSPTIRPHALGPAPDAITTPAGVASPTPLPGPQVQHPAARSVRSSRGAPAVPSPKSDEPASEGDPYQLLDTM